MKMVVMSVPYLSFAYLRTHHRYTREIPEPAPFLSRLGAKIEGFWVFPVIKITCLSGAYVTCIYCAPSVKINMHKTPHGTQRSWTHLFLTAWSTKTQRPVIRDPCLTTPLHRAVYVVWDLPTHSREFSLLASLNRVSDKVQVGVTANLETYTL